MNFRYMPQSIAWRTFAGRATELPGGNMGRRRDAEAIGLANLIYTWPALGKII